MTPGALDLLVSHPAQVGRWCGYPLLRDKPHGDWMRQMILGEGDMTLLAHRASYKTTCLAVSMAILLCAQPRRNLLFLRKTDEDAAEIIRQVKLILETEAMRRLTCLLYKEPVRLLRSDAWTVSTDCYAAPRGAPQLLGMGIGGSLTGKHADIIFTDDIVNLKDRVSPAERERTRGIYMELQNIRIRGGRIVNTGTPWHRDDAISLMPDPIRCDCYHSGLITPEQLERLRGAMSPSLFAANYELRHIAAENALFPEAPGFTADEALLWDGIAHMDAAYGGEDFTALTCGRRRGGTLYLYGRLWPGHVDRCMDAALAACLRLRCAPLLCEQNADKGYLARELRQRGAAVRLYRESANKYLKISTFLRKWWKSIVFLEGTDPEYIAQILDYSASAAHDDAPDSAACVCRALDRQ